MRRAFSYFFLIAISTAGAWYVTRHWTKFQGFREFDTGLLPFLIVLHVLYIYCQGLVFKIMAGSLGVKLSFREHFGLTVTSMAANYFVPGHLGIAAKGVYLKHVFSLPYAKFGAYFLAQTVLMTVSLAVCGVIGTLIVLAVTDINRGEALAIGCFFVAVILVLVLLLMLPYKAIRRFKFLRNMAASLTEGWQMIKTDRTTLTRVVSLNLVGILITGLIVRLLFMAFFLWIPYVTCFVIGVVLSFSSYFVITPANIGIQEMLMAFISHRLGTGFEVGMIAFGVNRVIQIAVVFGLTPIMTFLLGRSGERVPP